MSEEEKEKEQKKIEPGEDSPESGPDSREGSGVEAPAPKASESSLTGKELKFEMSDELKQALEEAEASLGNREKVNSAPASPSDAAPAGELELEGLESEPEKKFDPNAVDEIEEQVPPPPSPRELELKMQILDLRQQLRDKEKEAEARVKEMKQNLEQARFLQNQLESYKARVQKEKADWFNYGHEPLLKEIVQVQDNLERALDHAHDATDVKALREGVELTLRQFRGVLEKFGVTPIEPLGQPFNPEYHQAMMQATDDSAPSGTVIELYQKGYLLKDRLLRPAMVTVSKPSKKESPTQTESEPQELNQTNEPAPGAENKDED